MKLDFNGGPEQNKFHGKVVKTYFGNSPYADIDKLENGCFVVHNKVTGCEHHGFTAWADACECREMMSQRYQAIHRGENVGQGVGMPRA